MPQGDLSANACRIQAGRVSLQCFDYGQNGDRGRTPMLFLHGIQDFALSLDPICRAFAAEYHVVSFDLRGHGDSEHSGNYTLPHMVADLHAVLAHFQFERPVLVGHSLGSHIVTQYAAVFGGHGDGREGPRAVVSIDGLGAAMREQDVPVDDRRWRLRNGILGLLAPGSSGRPMQDLDDAAGLFCRFHPGLDFDHSRQLVELATKPHPHGGLQWKWDPDVLSIGLQSAPQVAEERWGWIECPTLLVTGGKAWEFFVRMRGLDPQLAQSAPEELDRRAALFPNATRVDIPEAGHMVHYDAPQRLVEIIREWL